ncbi:hypothetical protein [Andreprevotia lacus]|nr:hypothetical protein [Andreprevotia lacus]
MSVDPLQRAPAILALLRQQLRTAGASPRGAKQVAGKPAQTSARKKSEQELEKKLVARIKFIKPDDPQRQKKAFTAYIEAAVLAELGSGLVNEAGFHDMIDTICAQMLAEPALAQDIATVADQLLATSR